MNQEEAIKALKDNPQQAKQFNQVVQFINDAIKAEFPTFIKLVQFDVLSKIQKKAADDKLANNNPAEKQLTETLDGILKQVGNNLESSIIKQFSDLKGSI